jgi:hypothetical protein
MIKETERIYAIDLAILLPFLKIDMTVSEARSNLADSLSGGFAIVDADWDDGSDTNVIVSVRFNDDFTDCKPSDVLEQVRLWLAEWQD